MTLSGVDPASDDSRPSRRRGRGEQTVSVTKGSVKGKQGAGAGDGVCDGRLKAEGSLGDRAPDPLSEILDVLAHPSKSGAGCHPNENEEDECHAQKGWFAHGMSVRGGRAGRVTFRFRGGLALRFRGPRLRAPRIPPFLPFPDEVTSRSTGADQEERAARGQQDEGHGEHSEKSSDHFCLLQRHGRLSHRSRYRSRPAVHVKADLEKNCAERGAPDCFRAMRACLDAVPKVEISGKNLTHLW